jgi:malate synthase
VFDRRMPGPSRLAKRLPDLKITAEDLLAVPEGAITEGGLRLNLSVGVQYLASWLSGNGCVPINNLMEDAATAEISRAQVWQWIHHGAKLADGRPVTAALARAVLAEELAKLPASRYAPEKLESAARIFDEMFASDRFTEFLTIPAYERLN